MPTKRDYYDILAVNKTASGAEIKKAYRKMALQWHPDKNKSAGAEAKFKEISEAYEVLSNSQKRKTYDQFGHTAFTPGGARTHKQGPFTYTYTSGGAGFEDLFGGFSDPFEIFQSFFSGGSPFGARQRIPRYGLSLSFMEAAKGCEREVNINGKRKVKIPAGVDDGTRIRFGDFYVSIDVRPDKVFKRDGVDVFIDQEIPLAMAILGGVTEVPTIDDKVKLKVRPGTQAVTLVRLRNRGIPRLRGRGRGDQYVRLIVKIPEKLSKKQKELIKEFDQSSSL